jgi:hypothetical protein
VNVPGARQTYIFGIDGSTISGYYVDANNFSHGFVATPVPLPPTFIMGLVLVAVGAAQLCRRRSVEFADNSSFFQCSLIQPPTLQPQRCTRPHHHARFSAPLFLASQ